MSNPTHPTANSKPGKWGSIPPPRLPDEFLRLEPRLTAVAESALIRFFMFKSGRKLADENGRLRVLWGRIRQGTAGFWFLALFVYQLFSLGFVLRINFTSPLFWLVVVLLSFAAIVQLGTHLLSQSRTLFKILEHRVADWRSLPISGQDYAIAHWGGYLLLDPFWRKFPALALWTCCKEMEIRLQGCTGWDYYPPTFGINLLDQFERNKLPKDGEGRPRLEDQFNLAPDAFNYSQRLDYLAALWREYMEVWWPDQPWEAETRRAMLPSRAQTSSNAGSPRKQADSPAGGGS